MLVFEEREKLKYLEYPEKTLLEQGRESKNLAHIWYQCWYVYLGQISERRELSPLDHPCSRQIVNPTRIQNQFNKKQAHDKMFALQQKRARDAG